jgi:uncharacterized membrane protein YebE (DUF533 family)
MPQESTVESRYETYATLIAPAAAGCALGLLFGRGMGRRGSNIAALSLLAAGAAVAGPMIADLIQKVANRPSSQRGSQRRLDGIRNSALPEVDEFFAMEQPEGLLTR